MSLTTPPSKDTSMTDFNSSHSPGALMNNTDKAAQTKTGNLQQTNIEQDDQLDEILARFEQADADGTLARYVREVVVSNQRLAESRAGQFANSLQNIQTSK